jgi:serine/threonine protein kinase
MNGASRAESEARFVKYDALGQGPLATVYRGRHTALGLDVAIKELKDIFGYFAFLQRAEVIKRLKREICAQALVRHPGVVALLDQGCDVTRPFYVMELCSGGNLRQRIEASGGRGLAAADAVRAFLQLSYGLRAAHAQGLVHANLKPENVLFDHLGNAKLSDFGMGRVIELEPARAMPQIFVGNIAYLSPEQAAQAREVGPSSDVYAAGILLYEMLTGKLPGRRSPMPSQANDQVSARLDAIFDRMTQDSREQRYPDFDAVLADFYAAFEDGSWLKPGDLVLNSGAPASARVESSGPELVTA